VGAGLAEPAGPQEDQARVALVEPLPAEVPLLEGPGAVVLDRDVDVGEQVERDLLSLGGAEVEGDAVLVAADGPPERAGPGGVLGAEAADGVAAARVLDLDHVGAEVAEEGRRPGAGGGVTEVDDGQAGEG